MEETMNIIPEEVQPEATPEETTNTDSQEATTDTAEESPADSENQPEAEEVIPNADGEQSEDSDSSSEESVPEQPTIRVKFNKQQREYSVEEAAPLVEMGLKWDSFKECHEKLKFLASASEKSVSELVDALIDSSENALYQSVLNECDGNETLAKKLFEYQKSERNRKFEKFKQEEEQQSKQETEEEQSRITNLLANGFVELQKEIPGKFKNFAEVPDAIIQKSIDKKISLLDAYLRFEREEGKKVDAVKKKREETVKQSVGSMSENAAQPEPNIADFSKAFQSMF